MAQTLSGTNKFEQEPSSYAIVNDFLSDDFYSFTVKFFFKMGSWADLDPTAFVTLTSANSITIDTTTNKLSLERHFLARCPQSRHFLQAAGQL